MNFHTVQNTDERLAERDVADVQNGDGGQDAFLQQIGPCLASLHLNDPPEEAEHADDAERKADVD